MWVICDLLNSFLGIFASGLGLNRLRVGDRHGNLLLEHDLVSEEGDPVLEVGHDSVGCAPSPLTVRLVEVDGWNWLSFANWQLLVGLVVESD